MFDFDAGKFLIVGVIALIFIPPKDLPRVLRQAGQFVGKMRRMASDFQGQFMDAMREADMADIRAEAKKLADSARVDAGFDSVKDLDRHIVAKPTPPAASAAAAPEPQQIAAAPTAAPVGEDRKDETPVAADRHSV